MQRMATATSACTLGKILIIEDETGPRESLKMILKGNYEIRTASSISKALELLENEVIDLITLDFKLPGTPGSHSFSEIRKISPQTDIIVISGSGTLESAIEALRHGASDFINKPFGVMEVLNAVQKVFQKRNSQITLPQFSESDGVDLFAYAQVLAETLEGQDRYTHGHCERVAQISVSIAEEFGFTPHEQRQLMIASYLHDIGKLGIDRDIIRKTGPLNASEARILKSHPQRGVKLVAPLPLTSLARSVIRSHHEHWDGSGYPDGLKGEEISLAARIVHVADAYDAMTSDRPYRKAIPQDRVLQELRDGSGIQFDPDVVEVMLFMLQLH